MVVVAEPGTPASPGADCAGRARASRSARFGAGVLASPQPRTK